jgi:hypothetical protein
MRERQGKKLHLLILPEPDDHQPVKRRRWHITATASAARTHEQMLLNEKVTLVGSGDFIFQVKSHSAISANILAATTVDAPFKVAADDAMSRRDINDSDAPRRANIGTTTAARAFVCVNNYPTTKTGLGRARLEGISKSHLPRPQRQQQLFDL